MRGPGFKSTEAATMHTPPYQDSVTDGNAQPPRHELFVTVDVAWFVNGPTRLTIFTATIQKAQVGGALI